MKVNASALRQGNVIDHLNKLWVVAKAQNVTPGKGGAFMQAELRDIRGGTKRDERFRSTEQVERVTLDDREYQYLYKDGEAYAFMDTETYEQLSVPGEVIGDPAVFLQEGMKCNIRTFEGVALVVELPQTVVMEVVEADPVVKSQTAASSYKPAKLENGVRIMVPPHVATGTKIIVNIAEGTYLERFKG
jgi:elongation factor P